MKLSFVVVSICCLLAGVSQTLAEPGHSLIVAHRGLLRHAPENTLANFRSCLELRLGFEFDVEQTKDGQLICIHDQTVDRTTNGTGKVAEMTLAEVRKLDAGRWFDPRFGGQLVPTVDEVFALIAQYRHHQILIAVDLKAAGVGGRVVELAAKAKILHRLVFIGRTINSAPLRRQLREVSSAAEAAAVANSSSQFAQALAAKDATWVYFRYLPSAQEIREVHRVKKRAFIAGATVSGDLPKNWQHCQTVGIDGILTDYPLKLARALRSQ